MISLYDYLGKAAGKELGGKVWQYSLIRGVVSGFRTIENPAYKGIVALYPKEFLDEFFLVQKIFVK
jgi:hypothetical protein